MGLSFLLKTICCKEIDELMMGNHMGTYKGKKKANKEMEDFA
jgi:hypothetical protein